MRYNPATDNAVHNEIVQASMAWAANIQVEEVTRELSEVDSAIGNATLALWSSSHALGRLTPADMDRQTMVALRRDIADVVKELDRLSN